MGLMEVSLMHHVGIVLCLLWLLSIFDCCHIALYLISLIYLYLVHERYVLRLQRKLQFEESKQANQRRVLSDSETVRWLNHAVEKIWPICIEQIASQKILLSIIPWFLEKYKPWTAERVVVQHLYLGRNPPLFTEMRVLHQPSDDDHLVLELGMNFLTADDMSAILAVQLRKTMGFGMWTKLHLTSMHIEGKVLVGVKFIRCWPFLSRVRICFAEPPYFQMTVKPIFAHGLDVTELPGIAGWLDKLLSVAFEETLVEPNMLVVDIEKFISPQPEHWFSVHMKDPVAYAKVEILEGSDMKPSDLNGLADPYVKGQLGSYRFRTKTERKTLSPKWHEEFKIPIVSWNSQSVLTIHVGDKDHLIDDFLGDCSINIVDLRDGQRHDMWLPLQNVKTGRLHIAITIVEENVKIDDNPSDQETMSVDEKTDSFPRETVRTGSFSSIPSEKSPRLADSYEPINIQGQRDTGIWVHHPGSEVLQTWEQRKGKSRQLDTEVPGTPRNPDESNGSDESSKDKNPLKSVRRGFLKIFRRSSNKVDHSGNLEEPVLSPFANVRSVNAREGGVKLVMEGNLHSSASGKFLKEGKSSAKVLAPESPSKTNTNNKSEDSDRRIKYAFSRKGSTISQGDSLQINENPPTESDSSQEESLAPSADAPTVYRIQRSKNLKGV